MINEKEFKAYKALNPDMTASHGGEDPVKYAIGETKKEDVVPCACVRGMHCCRRVEDVFRVYPLDKSQTVVCEVTVPEEAMASERDGFVATDKLKIERIVPWDEVFRLMEDVTELNLSDTAITEVPPEIGQLKNLKVLNLYGTGITEVPPEIGGLKNLTRLYLYDAAITELPPEIGQLRNIGWLDLSGTGITEVPGWIGELENLRELDLHGTGITELPKEIGKLENLRELDLSGTGITEVPDALMERKESGELIIYGFHPQQRQRRSWAM